VNFRDSSESLLDFSRVMSLVLSKVARSDKPEDSDEINIYMNRRSSWKMPEIFI
jgi:hypothetical protein